MSTARSCTVSYRDTEGLEHSVEVTASSLYEAAARALREFRNSSLLEGTKPGLATRLLVRVKAPATAHEVSVKALEEWLACGAKSPKEQAVKASLRDLLA